MSIADLSKRLDSVEMRLERQESKLAGELAVLDLPITVERRLNVIENDLRILRLKIRDGIRSLEAAVEKIEAVMITMKIDGIAEE